MDRSSQAAGPVSQARRNGPLLTALQALGRFRPHTHPRTTAVLLLWAFGLFAMFSAPAPKKVTPEMIARFEQILQEAEKGQPARTDASQALFAAQAETNAHKVWFWRFRAPHREVVRKLQAKEAEKRKVVRQLYKQRDRLLSDAKAQLGLWSDAGLEESRQLFWRSFENGKVFARRQTFWDTFFNILAGRERNAIGMLIQLILTAMINFTSGLVCSVIIYGFQLPWLLASYQPGLVSGTVFFLIAMTAASSAVAAFLTALYGAGATAIYTVVTVSSSRRLQEGGYQQRRYVRYHQD